MGRTVLRLSVGLSTLIGEDEADVEQRFRALPGPPADDVAAFARDSLTGTPERILERAASFEELGVEELIVNFSSVPFSIVDRSMLDLFAETVLATARTR